MSNHSTSLPLRYSSAIELVTLVTMSILTFATLSHAQPPAAATIINPVQQQFLSRFCTDCHERGSAEKDVVLSDESIDWTKPESREQWELVQSLIDKQVMPPTDSVQPSVKERADILSWLDTQLVEHSPIGGTPLRRLSSREYRNTIAAIFELPNFQLPNNFPPDSSAHGFDNQGKNLMIAGSHLEAIAETASAIADTFFLQPPPAPEQSDVIALPKDLTISYSSACLIDGTMRLASSGSNLRRNATWPARFIAPATGKYLLDITAAASPNASLPAELEVGAMTNVKANSRILGKLNFNATAPSTRTIEVRLEKGETVTLRLTNGVIDYEDKTAYKKFLTQLFDDQPRLAAAWNAVGDPARGGSGWARVAEKLNDPNLDATPFINEEAKREAVVTAMAKNSVKSGETLVYRFFEQGPYLGIHRLKIVGPTEVYPSKDELLRLKRREKLTGLSETSSRSEIEKFLSQFLGKAFRRPAQESEIKAYADLIQNECRRAGSIDPGLHLAVRSALLSPAFLYRNIGDGELSDNELATRLSYFLQSMPPDRKLQELANEGHLGNTKTLVAQAKRLCSSPALATDFTTQWLGLEKLKHLLPDVRLMKNFKPTHKTSMMREVQRTFQHVLDNNLPVHDLVTPDFIFTDEILGWEFYELQQYKPKKNKKIPKGMRQVPIERDARRGGLLTMPAVLMATANGVDTQPVLRGVWVLENILGSPPPEPPDAVPALTPDTRGTNSPKERLSAHMSSEGCAACHKSIDPLGFVLENFDPVGRWRDHYPTSTEKKSIEKKKPHEVDGARIDASGTLPGGYELNDIQDLKRWLKDNPEPFVRCISEKLLSYATGRQMNYRERKMIKEIVTSQATNEYRFRDLLLALIQSEIFRTK